eukprot:430392-Pleurochrysis_carterae.AAC.4
MAKLRLAPYINKKSASSIRVYSRPFANWRCNFDVRRQRSEAFLAEFDRVDPQLRQRLHAGWPQQLPVLGLSALDTNALCVYAGWSVVQHQELIRGAHHANH